ncbi:MAG: branched-chain amino acid ABC transporter permease [Thermodesulfobacteriota bacterium]|jgi:branched-chain amino acid transport system permease protein
MERIKDQLIHFTPAMALVVLLTTAPAWIDISIMSLLTKIMIFGLLAMSLDVVFGYVGLWSFCHAALFGVAAYTNGIMIQLFNITSFWIAAPMSILVTAVVSALLAWIALRMSGIYFLLITLALGQLIFSTVFVWRKVTGGSQGLINIPYPDIGIDFSPAIFYYFTLIIILICGCVLHYLLKSPFGYSLQGIRENETRMIALGFNTWKHKFLAFVISGAFAGIAGILYVHYNGIVVPTDVDMASSGLVVIMVIIGGSGTLWGAMIGSGVIYALSYFVSLLTPERWPLILGACFVTAVMFARGGLFPQLCKLWDKIVTPENKLLSLGSEMDE